MSAALPTVHWSRSAWLRAGTALVATATALAALRLLATQARDRPLLGWASGFMRAVTGLGGWLYDAARARPVALGVTLGLAAALLLLAWLCAVPGPRRDAFSGGFAAALAALSCVLLVAGQPMLAALAAAAAAVVMARTAPPPATGMRLPRALVLVPVGLALLLRFYSLAEFPAGYAQHAAIHHSELSIPYYEKLFPAVAGGDWSSARAVLQDAGTNQHGPSSLVVALGFGLMGVSPLATRLISAALGTLTVLLAWAAGRRLVGDRFALVFAFLLAASPWHVSVSRYCDTEHVLSPLHVLLLLWLIERARVTGAWLDRIGVALVLGLGWYVYAPNQLLVVVAAPLLLVASLRPWPRRLAGWTKVAIPLLVFLALAVPAVRSFIARGQLIPVRTGYVEANGTGLGRLARHLEMTRLEAKQLFIQADDPWFFKPGGGLSGTEAALLLPGVAICLLGASRRSERWRSTILLGLLTVGIPPGILAPDPSFRRLIITALAALALAALVLDRLFAWVERAGVRRSARIAAAVLLGVGYISVNAHVYFDLVHVFEAESHQQHRAAAELVAARLGKERCLIVTGFEWDRDDYHRYLRLFAYDALAAAARRGLQPSDLYAVALPGGLAAALDAMHDGARAGAVLVEQHLLAEKPGGVDIAAEVRARFPASRERTIDGRTGEKLLTVWEVASP